jgi:trehalose 6-phosphate synthase/phosphatase
MPSSYVPALSPSLPSKHSVQQGRKEILDGMLGANLICFQVRSLPLPFITTTILTRFQTYSYSRHFTSTCVRVCGYESTTSTTPRGGGVMGIDVEGHVSVVMHCPVGVDAERVGRDV